MIGFVGTRTITDLKDGRFQQRIICGNDEDVKFWKGVFPEGQTPRAAFPANMRMFPNVVGVGPNPHEIIFQGVEERDQWHKTFLQSNNFEHYAEWIAPRVLLLGSKPIPLKAGEKPKAEPEISQEEKWRKMTDAKLRTAAAELGLPNIDPKEGREMLIARMKRHKPQLVTA